MEYFDVTTILFIIAALVIFYQLRNVLGRRTGNERRQVDPYSVQRNQNGQNGQASNESTAENVISLPRKPRPAETAAERYAEIDAYAPEGTELNAGLRAIRDVDPSFEPKGFINGAKMAYEMIVTAYADGDRKTLKNLLSKEVNDGFVAALDERQKRGETVQSNFVGIDKAEISSADVKGTEAHVTLRISCDLISATRSSDGSVIDGDPETVTAVRDVWTFARDTRSKDPNWKLSATEAED